MITFKDIKRLLNPEVRKRFFMNIKKSTKTRSLESFITHSAPTIGQGMYIVNPMFFWKHTPEGEDFWSDICSDIINQRRVKTRANLQYSRLVKYAGKTE